MADTTIAIQFLAQTQNFLSGLNGLDNAVGKFGGKVEGIGKGISGIGQSMLPISAALGAGLGVAAVKALEFEKSMAGTSRAIGLSAKESEKFGLALQDLAPKVGLLPKELASIADEVAKAGVQGIENIQKVTETVAKSAMLLDLPAQQVAESFGKISSVYSLTGQQTDLLAAKINYLGDAIGGKEADIMKIVAASGAAASSSKTSAENIAALAAVYSRLGVDASTASNAIKAQFGAILEASTGKNKKYNEVLSTLGIKYQDLATLLQKPGGMTQAVVMLNEKMAGLKGASQSIAIAAMYGNNYNDTIGLAINRTDLVSQAFKKAGDNTAAMAKAEKEWAAVQQSTSFQLKAAQAQIENIAITIGQAILPAVNSLLKAIAPTVSQFAEFARANPGIVKVGVAVAAIGAVAAPLAIAIGAVVAAIGAMAATPVLAGILGVTAAIAGIGVAAYAISKAWSPVSKWFGDTLQWMRRGVTETANWIGKAFSGAWGGLAKFGASIGKYVADGLLSAGNAFRYAGQMLLYTFSKGLESYFQQPINAIKWLVEKIRSYLPSSDAKLGALSDLSAAGRALPQTFAKGIASASPQSIGATASLAGQVRSHLPTAAPTRAPVSNSTSSQVINLTINAATGNGSDIVAAIRAHSREILALLNQESSRQSRAAF